MRNEQNTGVELSKTKGKGRGKKEKSQLTPNPLQPIGVFDSGLGGLTVVGQLRRQLPFESLLSVADQAHVPYGGRDLKQISDFACGISSALLGAGCKAIVMACNISTAAALQNVQERYPNIPILGVIRPGAEVATQISKERRMGVLATEARPRRVVQRPAVSVRLSGRTRRLCRLTSSVRDALWDRMITAND